MDSGLVGFYDIATKCQQEGDKIDLKLSDENVILYGYQKDLKSFLNKTYEYLLEKYYNTSTRKQKEENAGFYYDTKNDNFVRFPKTKPMGIACLIYNKYAKPTQKIIKYDKKTKKLPEAYAYIQDSLDTFLKETELEIKSSGLLVDGPSEYKPKINFVFANNQECNQEICNREVCFICDTPSSNLTHIDSTVFPMLSGKSGPLSFNSNIGNPDKICWKCNFISRFVPVNGFYAADMDNCHIYFPYSSSLEKMYDTMISLHSLSIQDPFLFRNFENRLGGYFVYSFELMFNFLYSLYDIILTRVVKIDDKEIHELDYAKLWDLNINKSPIEFFILHTKSLGGTQMCKMIWPFHDAVYLFRLLDLIEKNRISTREVMSTFVEHNEERKDFDTIARNKICECILKKQSIVEIVERLVYRINSPKMKNIKSVLDFTVIYEKTITGDNMKQEIIDTAIGVGKEIGKILSDNGRKGKNELYRIRKTRKPIEFLNEINRIQMRYDDVSIPTDLYYKGESFINHFGEFKQFCMIAALNTYNYYIFKNIAVKNNNEISKE